VFGRILVGFDGSGGAWRALKTALALAKEHGSEVHVLSVEDRLPHFPEIRAEVEEEAERAAQLLTRVQQEARALAEEEGVQIKGDIVAGHPAQAIVHFAAQRGVDLIVIGNSGRSGIWGNFLGATADKVIRHAQCSVLVVR